MKFSIRDLLLVTVIVALALGWWVDRKRLSQVIEHQKLELEAMRVQEEAARAVAEVEAAARAAVQAAPITISP